MKKQTIVITKHDVVDSGKHNAHRGAVHKVHDAIGAMIEDVRGDKQITIEINMTQMKEGNGNDEQKSKKKPNGNNSANNSSSSSKSSKQSKQKDRSGKEDDGPKVDVDQDPDPLKAMASQSGDQVADNGEGA